MTPDDAAWALDRALRYALSHSLRGADADDAAGDALLALVERDGEHDPARGASWRGWAARAMFQAVRGWATRQRRSREVMPLPKDAEDTAAGPAGPAGSHETVTPRTHTEEAVLQLARAGRSQTEIAALASVSKVTVARTAREMRARARREGGT